jgi:outer membrane protein OmpA-like peptidoglycan-associated protein
MKKYFLPLLTLAVAFALSCTSKPAPKVSKDVNVSVDVPAKIIVSNANKILSRLPLKNFEYKSSKIPKQEWEKWTESAAPIVEDIIEKLPDGYVLQITGHADISGPELPVGEKPGNIKISTDRAKSVWTSLFRRGINSTDITYRGVGSSELTYKCNPRDSCQRRVTFQAVSEK